METKEAGSMLEPAFMTYRDVLLKDNQLIFLSRQQVFHQ